MLDVSTSNAKGHMQLVGLAGQGGSGKDTLFEQVFLPRGFIRLQMTLYRKVWLVSTGQATWEEVFVTKPPHVRKLLQEDITQVRYDHDEEIWLRVLQHSIRAIEEIIEFISIRPLVAMASNARESYAAHSRLP